MPKQDTNARTFLIVCIAMMALLGCQPSSSHTQITSSDPCDRLAEALNQTYFSSTKEGFLAFKGGLKGTLDISGIDYNSMICTFTVTNCADGTLSMICDGGQFNTNFSFLSRDTVFFGDATYIRKK